MELLQETGFAVAVQTIKELRFTISVVTYRTMLIQAVGGFTRI